MDEEIAIKLAMAAAQKEVARMREQLVEETARMLSEVMDAERRRTKVAEAERDALREYVATRVRGIEYHPNESLLGGLRRLISYYDSELAITTKKSATPKENE